MAQKYSEFQFNILEAVFDIALDQNIKDRDFFSSLFDSRKGATVAFQVCVLQMASSKLKSIGCDIRSIDPQFTDRWKIVLRHQDIAGNIPKKEALDVVISSLLKAEVKDITAWNTCIDCCKRLGNADDRAKCINEIIENLDALNIKDNNLWMQLKLELMTSSLKSVTQDKQADASRYPYISGLDARSACLLIHAAHSIAATESDGSHDDDDQAGIHAVIVNLMKTGKVDISNLNRRDHDRALSCVMATLNDADIPDAPNSPWRSLKAKLLDHSGLTPAAAFNTLSADCASRLIAKVALSDGDDDDESLNKTSQCAIHNAIVSGRLKLNAIVTTDGAIDNEQKRVKAADPNLNWSAISQPETHPAATEIKFCNSPSVQNGVSKFIQATLTMHEDIVAKMQLMSDAADKSGYWELEKVDKSIVSFLNRIGAMKNGKPDSNFSINKGVLGELFVKKAGSFEFKNNIIGMFQDWDKRFSSIKPHFGNDLPFAKNRNAWLTSVNGLLEMEKSPAFNTECKAFQNYTVKPVDKEDVTALVLGDEVSCCLSTSGRRLDELVRRLANPASIPVAVHDEKGTVLTVAWCFLCKDTNHPDGPTSLVVDFTDMKPRLTQPHDVNGVTVQNVQGNHIIEQLQSSLPELAKAFGATGKVYIGHQAHGRMELFPAFQQRQYSKAELEILGGNDFLGEEHYKDNIGKDEDEGFSCN